ncbi:MAG TPA: cytochrome b/b6 domain-containing protein, partial [Steroidobacteraceae bacterium]|nr:cytochrome b/b6 domain-containing protein [Steroidobacteraceae bacterium]
MEAAPAPSVEPQVPTRVRERVLNDGRTAVYRHPLPVRVWHWINVLCLLVLIPSGLQILNAHPALYWGNASTFGTPWVDFG